MAESSAQAQTGISPKVGSAFSGGTGNNSAVAIVGVVFIVVAVVAAVVALVFWRKG